MSFRLRIRSRLWNPLQHLFSQAVSFPLADQAEDDRQRHSSSPPIRQFRPAASEGRNRCNQRDITRDKSLK